jgi:hypothetical protein
MGACSLTAFEICTREDTLNEEFAFETQDLEKSKRPGPHRVRSDGRFCGRCGRRNYAGRGDQPQPDLFESRVRAEPGERELVWTFSPAGAGGLRLVRSRRFLAA